jgi:hypothetical protein
MSDEVDSTRRTGPGRAERRLGSALIDGVYFRNKPVVYTDVDGWAIVEGDICLGRVEEVEAASDRRRAAGRANAPLSDVVVGDNLRWPGGVVPFEIDPALPDQGRVHAAINHWQARTPIRLVARGDEADFVRFVVGDGCRSFIGRQGGEQTIELSGGCDAGRTIHEIFHAVGAWHEQSREDRDSFVRIVWENIEPGEETNFIQHITDSDDVGPYDYGSIMHYERNAFTRNGEDTIIPLQAGVEIGQRVALSDLDLEAVRAMYPDLVWPVKDPKEGVKDRISKDEDPKDGTKDPFGDHKEPSDDEPKKDAKFDIAFKEEPKEEYRDPPTVLKDSERFGDIAADGPPTAPSGRPSALPFVLAGGSGSAGSGTAAQGSAGLLPQLHQLLATFAELNFRGQLDGRTLAAWRMTTKAYLKLLGRQ